MQLAPVSVAGGGRGRTAGGGCVLPVPDHVLQRDEYRHHSLFILGLVDIDAVLVMQGDHLLRNDCDDLVVLIVQLEIQAKNVAPELPAQALNVGDGLDQMEQLVGKLKGCAVGHGHIVPLTDRKDLLFDVRDGLVGVIKDVRFIPQREEFRLGIIDDILIRIGDCDPVVQCKHLGTGEQGPSRYAEALHIVDVCFLPGFTKTMML